MKRFGIWFNFKIQPENEWLKFFDKLKEANIHIDVITPSWNKSNLLKNSIGDYGENIWRFKWEKNLVI